MPIYENIRKEFSIRLILSIKKIDHMTRSEYAEEELLVGEEIYVMSLLIRYDRYAVIIPDNTAQAPAIIILYLNISNNLYLCCVLYLITQLLWYYCIFI